jgi:hypothetical protein
MKIHACPNCGWSGGHATVVSIHYHEKRTVKKRPNTGRFFFENVILHPHTKAGRNAPRHSKYSTYNPSNLTTCASDLTPCANADRACKAQAFAKSSAGAVSKKQQSCFFDYISNSSFA